MSVLELATNAFDPFEACACCTQRPESTMEDSFGLCEGSWTLFRLVVRLRLVAPRRLPATPYSRLQAGIAEMLHL